MSLVSGWVVTHLDCAVLGQTADESVQSPVLELPLWTLWSWSGVLLDLGYSDLGQFPMWCVFYRLESDVFIHL